MTDPIAEPEAPSQHCKWHGQPAVCALDGLVSILQWRGKLEAANVDRAAAAKISAGPQP